MLHVAAKFSAKILYKLTVLYNVLCLQQNLLRNDPRNVTKYSRCWPGLQIAWLTVQLCIHGTSVNKSNPLWSHLAAYRTQRIWHQHPGARKQGPVSVDMVRPPWVGLVQGCLRSPGSLEARSAFLQAFSCVAGRWLLSCLITSRENIKKNL